MIRTITTTVLAAGLALMATSLPAQAQPGPGHAPENLRQLSLAQRVRVIENEYTSRSRGRALPDDQLEYYLSQVDSGWTLSRIRQDIDGSLGLAQGQGRYGRNWNGSNWSGQNVVCSSTDKRRRTCTTPFRGRPVLIENISDARCVEGVNFGGGNGSMWVDKGCRGRFAGGRDNGGAAGNGQTVRCESDSNRQRTCQTGFRGNAVLVRQLSKARCVEGQTWGQSRNGSVWVSGGCRGEFAQGGNGAWNQGGNWNGNGQTVSCSSSDNRRQTCNWDSRWGRPVVVEQISSTRCQEGRNWGWDGRNALWVDGGCRARFGSR
jgi:hypothetical protein